MKKQTIEQVDYYIASEVEARIAELQEALREAMEWNWCDDDMNEGVRAQCERALSPTGGLSTELPHD